MHKLFIQVYFESSIYFEDINLVFDNIFIWMFLFSSNTFIYVVINIKMNLNFTDMSFLIGQNLFINVNSLFIIVEFQDHWSIIFR